jgi:heparosan-N-sulfate-glucuronate 5-epimerase
LTKNLPIFFKRKCLLLIIALVISIFLVNNRGDKWEHVVRSSLYAIINDSIPVYSIVYVDRKGIPYVDYKTLNGITPGKQYNPTIVCNYALDYYNKFLHKKDSVLLAKFFNCAGWLLNNLRVKENYALYIFDWQQPWYDSVGVPYTSGMTSGLAIKVFDNAYRLTSDERYLHNARMLLRSFYIPVSSGGFTYKDKDGWWYEELADTSMHTPRILDGHIFAVAGLYDHVQLTNDDSAKFLFNKGIEVLKSRLQHYDIGNGWSYYDAYHLPADRKYHRLLTEQMKELQEMTGDVFFYRFYEKWNQPLSRSYLRSTVEDRNLSGITLFIITCLVCWLCLVTIIKLVKLATKA